MAATKKIKINSQVLLSFILWNVPRNRQKRFLKMRRGLLVLSGSAVLLVGVAIVCSVLIFRIQIDKNTVKQFAYPKSMYHVADALSARPMSILVASKGVLNVLRPTLGIKRQTFVLNTCPAANDVVLKQLQKRSIAILVYIDNQPGKQQCTLGQIVQAYGRPNASNTITGSITAPREVLLYYDNGPQLSGPLKPVSPPQAPATVVPVTLSSLSAPSCAGRIIVSFVAHQDDDLLFMNPDHVRQLRGGVCLRTVYLTAGDAGRRSNYWLGREKGAEAAYDTMIGHGSSLWIERYVGVNSHEYIKMASPRGNPAVTLVFVHLPDGNLAGNGFSATHYESLAKLANGGVGAIHTVDGQSSYSKDDMVNLLVRLMQFYHPNEVDTQTPLNASVASQDHSDHMATGQLTATAYGQYAQDIPLKYYTGYPIALLSPNISGQDLSDKTAVFSAYALHDQLVCQNPISCPSSPYASWLMRQYTYTPGDPLIPAASVPGDSDSSITTPASTSE